MPGSKLNIVRTVKGREVLMVRDEILPLIRLRTLVDELMELSRFDARAERIAVEPVDLGRLVRSVAAARLPEATVHAPAHRLIIDTDPRRLDRILGNLLDNAREHAPSSAVEVTLSTMADGVVVAFRGTESPATLEGLKDWLLTDAANLLILPEGRLGTDLAVTLPAARGEPTSPADIAAPADSPKMVTLPGSPPNAAMLARTQSSNTSG